MLLLFLGTQSESFLRIHAMHIYEVGCEDTRKSASSRVKVHCMSVVRSRDLKMNEAAATYEGWIKVKMIVGF